MPRFSLLATNGVFRGAQPKAASELGQAQAAADAAGASETAAQEAFDRLEQAMLDCTEAEKEIARINAALPVLQADLKIAESGLARAGRLRQKLQLRKKIDEARAATHKRLADAVEAICKLTSRIVEAEGALGPKRRKTAQLEQALRQAKAMAEEAEKAWNAALTDATTRRDERDLAHAYVTLFEKRKHYVEVKGRHEEIDKTREQLAALRDRLAKLPVMTEKDLKKLREAANEVVAAEAALSAMAAGIEVVASDQVVMLDGLSLAAGKERTVTNVAEITVGGGVRLRVRPGGGTNLAEARDRVATAQDTLGTMLAKCGVATVEAAEVACPERREIAADIKSVEKRLQDLGADTIDNDLQKAKMELIAAQAEVDQRSALVPEATVPDSEQAAREWARTAKGAAAAAEKAERDAKSKLDTARADVKKAETELDDHRNAIAAEENALAAMANELAFLIQTYGDEATRVRELARLAARRQRSPVLVGATKALLDALNPDQLATDKVRLQQAIARHEENLNDAGNKRTAALALLRNNGTSNPAADLASARLAATRARERLALVKRRTDAVRRLHELFTEEQQQLAERFNQPLADKITGYLQCLFGPDAQVKVESNGTAFSGISVIRPTDGGGATEFDVLSGGTKEQVGAAVRLAVAEILAEDHGGTLPVVFDDAFAYSDPDRVKGVQRMLFEASQRGLQVIVLACNPNDYVGLGGAATVQLRPPLPSPAGSRPIPSAAAGTTEVDDTRDENEGSCVEVTDDLRQEFLQALAAVGGSSGNMRLHSTLGWDAQCYEAVRDDLVGSGRVKKGQGKGGSVRLA